MAGLDYVVGRTANLQSYRAFETLVWTSFHAQINRWRTYTLRLPHIYGLATAVNLVTAASLPFSAMWSPSFVPKPDDWPEQCEVVGTFVVDQKKDLDLSPFEDLQMWLDNGPKPIFVGFGSMVIEKPEALEKIIKEAARVANVRVVVQSSWTKLDVEDGTDGLCHNVGPCPHDWLLPQCCAVVHHGGAGTTAAGLRFGLPTMVCPFFADQFMWGFFVELAGVGPKACPINKLTAEIMAEKLKELASEELQTAAKALAKTMALENGIEAGRQHFVDSLWRENMLCDVSLLLGQTVSARYQLTGTGLREHGVKVSSEVAALLEAENAIDWHSIWNWIPTWSRINDRYWYAAGIRRHPVTSYSLAGRVKYFHHGIVFAIYGFIYGFFNALGQIYMKPDKYARRYGAFGCMFGLLITPFFILKEFLFMIIVFVDRLAIAFANGIFGRDFNFLIDPNWQYGVHQTAFIEFEMESFLTRGIPKARRQDLLRALDFVVGARIVFENAKPFFPSGHRHFKVVDLDKLVEQLSTKNARSKLRMNDFECGIVRSNLDQLRSLPSKSIKRSARQLALEHLGQFKRPELERSRVAASSSNEQLEKNETVAPVKEDLDSITAYRQRMQHLMQRLTASLYEQERPKTVEVSFSSFIKALQSTCGDKCLEGGISYRATTILSSLSGKNSEEESVFAQYLN